MKHKFLLKTMLLLCTLMVGSVSVWAESVTFTFSSLASANSWENGVAYTSVVISPITLNAVGGGNNGKYYTSDNSWRMYKGGTVSITAAAGYEITAVSSTPSQSFTISDGAASLSCSATIKFTAITVTYSSSTSVATPTFSPLAGAVPSGTSVTISSTPGATIYYTTDGSDPTTGSSVYSSAITIDAAKTIKAFAVKSGLTDSGIATAAYTIAKVATPTFSPAAGEVDKDSEITITCATDGATIYYTTDGTTPTASSTAYNPASKPTIDDNKTIKAIAVKTNYLNSDVSSATYTYARVKDYNLVTSVSQIVSGKHYLISSGTSSGAVVMDYQDTNNRKTKSVSFSGSTLKVKSATEFIIQGPDKDGNYAFYDAKEEGYLYAASKTANYLKTDAYRSNLSPFSISIDGSTHEASIIGQGENTHNVMRYNGSSSPALFSCYGSASQSPVFLFVLDDEDTPTESVTVGSAGYTTYTTLNAVSFPIGVESYIVTATGDDQVTLTATGASVPARTPLVIKASKGDYDLTSVVSPSSATGNLLKEAYSTTTGDGSTIYALGIGKTGANEGKVGFYLVGSGVIVPAGKAYLKITGGGAKEFFTFDFGDEPDGIETVDNRQQTTDNSPIYNLAGQRISKMQKGINIINGKKVLK